MSTRVAVASIFLGPFVQAVLCVPVAEAHVQPLGTITTQLSIQGSQIALYTTLSQNINVDGYPVASEVSLYDAQFKKNFLISQNDIPCTFVLSSFDPSVTAARSTFRGVFTCPNNIEDLDSLNMHAEIFTDQFTTFDHFTSVFFKGERYEILFNQNYTNYPEDVIAQPAGSEIAYYMTVAWSFIWMGMLHIFTGYDHILFLFSIVLLSRSVRKLLAVVTAFTIAHSITLIVGSFHILEISAHIVEPAIALTIAYVAYRNITEIRKGTDTGATSERWMLAFGFGLIHGLGFASALAETQIPQIFFIPSLISFNIGIELAQLCILAVVLPLLLLADKWRYRTKLLLVLASSILVLALAWFAVRIFVGEACVTVFPAALSALLCV